MKDQPLVVTNEQAEIVKTLHTLYQGYATSDNQSQVRTLIWANLHYLEKQLSDDAKTGVSPSSETAQKARLCSAAVRFAE